MATSSLTNTGNQPYTAARVDYLASYLQQLMPGMTHDAAVKWIKAEQGVNGNVLGVTYNDSTGQHLYQYQSQEAGLRAAVSLINRSSNYSGIRTSLSTGSTVQQLIAIASSPWNGGHYRNGGTFGVSIGGSAPKAPSGGSTSSSPTAIPTQLVSTPTSTNLAALLGLDPTTPVDAAHMKVITDAIKAKEASGQFSHTIAQNLLQLAGTYGVATGHGAPPTLLGNIGVDPTTGNQPLAGPFQALKDSAAVVGDVGAFLFDSENWQYIGAILVGIPLALIGFYLLAGVQTGGANA